MVGVGVRVAQGRGVRADRAVGEQVARGAAGSRAPWRVRRRRPPPPRPSSPPPPGRARSPPGPARPGRSSAPAMSGPDSSCSRAMPSSAARVRVARCRPRRWSGVIDSRATRRTTWCAVTGQVPGLRPAHLAADLAAPAPAGRRRPPPSARRRGTGRRRRRRTPGRAPAGSVAGAPARSSRPSRGRAPPRRGLSARLPRPGAGSRPGSRAPVRSRPVSARPVEVACTWASTKAGVTRAPAQVDDLVRLERDERRVGADPGERAAPDEQRGGAGVVGGADPPSR